MQYQKMKKVALFATLLIAGSGTVAHATAQEPYTSIRPESVIEQSVSTDLGTATTESTPEEKALQAPLAEESTAVETTSTKITTDAPVADAPQLTAPQASVETSTEASTTVTPEASTEASTAVTPEVSAEAPTAVTPEASTEASTAVTPEASTEASTTDVLGVDLDKLKQEAQDAMKKELESSTTTLDAPVGVATDGQASVLEKNALTPNALLTTPEGLQYTDEKGALYVNRWRTVDGNTYYFGADGYAVGGLLLGANGDLYYFDMDTKVQYKNRWRTVDGETYLFNANGVARRGQYKNPENGDLYYFDDLEFFQYKNVVMKIDGKLHYFNRNGVSVGGLAPDAKTGDVYYLDPVTKAPYVNRWRTVDGTTYYFGADSKAVSGLQVDKGNGSIYYFDMVTKGQYKERWRTVDGNTYWFNKNGVAIGGELNLNGVLHFFDPVTKYQFKDRWKTLDGITYYFNAAGITQKGILVHPESGHTHFFDYRTGAQAREQLIATNGYFYYFDKNGVAWTNRTYIDVENNHHYNFDSKGRTAVAFYAVDGIDFESDTKGNLVRVQTQNMKDNKVYVKFELGTPWMYDEVLNAKKTILSRGIVTIGTERYFFNSNGSLATGTQLLKYGDVYSVSSYGLVHEKKTSEIQHGVDISRYNGTVYTGYAKTRVDFEQLKKSGINYVIIRAGSGWKGGYKDQLFEEHYKLAKEAGLGVGTYFYTYATNAKDAKKEMDLYMSYIKGKSFDYPVYIDMEEEGAGQQGSLSKKALTDLAVNMMRQLEDAGYYTGIYANANWLTNKFDISRLQPYDVWLAQWRNNITYKGHTVEMWQYADDGKFPGHTTPFDLNVSLVDYPTIIRGAGRNGYFSAE